MYTAGYIILHFKSATACFFDQADKIVCKMGRRARSVMKLLFSSVFFV